MLKCWLQVSLALSYLLRETPVHTATQGPREVLVVSKPCVSLEALSIPVAAASLSRRGRIGRRRASARTIAPKGKSLCIRILHLQVHYRLFNACFSSLSYPAHILAHNSLSRVSESWVAAMANRLFNHSFLLCFGLWNFEVDRFRELGSGLSCAKIHFLRKIMGRRYSLRGLQAFLITASRL